MLSSSSHHNIWHMDHLENWPLLKLDVQIPKVSGFRWAFSLSSCRAFCSIPSNLYQLKVQRWISSFILRTSCLEDVNLRIINFRLCKINRLKVFNPWFPASWARSQSSTNPTFYTDFSLLLDFSGSSGFDTWRIYVPLFWATCRLFFIFLLSWILERFLSVDIITLFTLVLLKPLGGVIFVWSFFLLCFTLFPFVTKKESNFWFGPGLYF
jgi:hypothetical protein